MAGKGGPARGASYADVLANRRFLPIFLANSLSAWGDNIARITVAIVVYDRTGSALATAATFAVSLLPTVIGRGLLSTISDRLPYRDVLVACHLLRAVLVAVLLSWVAAGQHLGGLLALLFLIEVVGGPALPAGQMLLTDLFPVRRVYAKAFALGTLSDQLNQALGLALGGGLVFLLGPPKALFLDLVTFLVAAAVIAVVVDRRPPHGHATAGLAGFLRDTVDGARHVVGSTVLRSLLGLSLIGGLAMAAPEALAIPYAQQHDGAEHWGGLLMASPILGAVAGLLVLGRMPAERQNRIIIPMALLMPTPLLVTVFEPPLAVVGAAWFLCGALQSFMLPLQSTFTLAVAAPMRGRVFGLAGSLSVAVTGVAFLAAGWLAGVTTTAAAVGICAILSLGGLILLAAAWPRREVTNAVRETYGPPGESLRTPGGPRAADPDPPPTGFRPPSGL